MSNTEITEEIAVYIGEMLSPCPFCGDNMDGFAGFDLSVDAFGKCSNGELCICCENCGANGALAKTAEQAISAWNKRTALKSEEVNNA